MSEQGIGILLLSVVCCGWPVLFHLAATWLTKKIQAGEIRLPWKKDQQ